jgi:polyphosphate kinase
MSVSIADLTVPTVPALDRARLTGALTRDLDELFTHRSRLTRHRLHRIVGDYDAALHELLLPELAAEGVTFVDWSELTPFECMQTQRWFHRIAQPLLTPMAVDATHPTPRIPSLAINLAIRVGDRLAHLSMPPQLPRMLRIRPGRYLPIESMVAALLDELLVGVDVTEWSCYRVSRNATTGAIVRLEAESTASERMSTLLRCGLAVADEDVYVVRSALAMGDALGVEPRAVPAAARSRGRAVARSGTGA